MKLLMNVFLSLCLSASIAFAGDGDTDADKPSITASRTVTAKARVAAINQETREVTLDVEGGQVTITAGPEVRNLAQVQVGDEVTATYHEEATISVHANPEGLEPSAGSVSASGRAEEGAMPGAGTLDTVVITAVVADIDLENNTFKLRGPRGNVEEFTARNPDNLKRAAVGDLVVITVTQAMGITVDRPEGE